jgi:hypothetical protein
MVDFLIIIILLDVRALFVHDYLMACIKRTWRLNRMIIYARRTLFFVNISYLYLQLSNKFFFPLLSQSLST